MARSSAGSHGTLSGLVRTGLFLVGSLVAVATFLLAHWTIGRLSHEVAVTSRLLAQFCARASYPATRDAEIEQLVSGLIRNIDFPIVLTDSLGVPRAWKGVGVDPESVPDESLDSLGLGLPIAPPIAARVDLVRRRVSEMDRRSPPIPMTRYLLAGTVGAVHYGEPPALELLRWSPIALLIGTSLLVVLGLWGLTVIRQAEGRSIWVGMAKETAHQLGTPLSSLMGWSEALRERVPVPAAGEVRMPAAELGEAVTEMERDVDRLRKVAQRFSHIGSEPNLQLGDAGPIVRDVVSYLRRRLPRGGRDVQLIERVERVPPVRLSPELLEWALENLVTNALSALDRPTGRIEVALGVSADGRAVEITVSDDGRGMSAREQRRAFEPGYTTKRRGWGLGLALARRVVEDYHGGRIWIRSSEPERGTAVSIRLPIAG